MYYATINGSRYQISCVSEHMTIHTIVNWAAQEWLERQYEPQQLPMVIRVELDKRGLPLGTFDVAIEMKPSFRIIRQNNA